MSTLLTAVPQGYAATILYRVLAKHPLTESAVIVQRASTVRCRKTTRGPVTRFCTR